MPINSRKKKSSDTSDIVTRVMEFPDVVFAPAPPEKRKVIKISKRTKRLYAAHDHSKDDPENPVLPPEKWAKAMRRDEMFRPLKKQTTVRIDADVLAWLKSKGAGHISRVNDILRSAMIADLKH